MQECSGMNLKSTVATDGFNFRIINSLMESWGVRLTWIDCKSYSTFNLSDRENAKFVTLTLLCPRGVGTPIPGMGEKGVGKGKGLELAIVGLHEGAPP